MKAALRAELRKLRYQRSTWGILISASVLACISTISMIFTTQLPERSMLIPLTDERMMHTAIAASASAYIFALVLGIVMSTTEFRHSTAVATYLAEPNRKRVMVAKMITAAGMGAIVQLVATGLAMVAGTLFAARYDHFALAPSAYVEILSGSALLGVVLAVVGVAVGSLIRSQMIAVVVAIMYIQLVEGLLIVFADWLGKWSMRGAITSILQIAVETPEVSLSSDDMFGPWVSVLLLLGYAAVFAVIATVTSMRRDVD